MDVRFREGDYVFSAFSGEGHVYIVEKIVRDLDMVSGYRVVTVPFNHTHGLPEIDSKWFWRVNVHVKPQSHAA